MCGQQNIKFKINFPWITEYRYKYKYNTDTNTNAHYRYKYKCTQHLLKMNNLGIYKIQYEYIPIGRRKVGQPSNRWTVQHPRRKTNIEWLIHRCW
jgi:hypothetical protein